MDLKTLTELITQNKDLIGTLSSAAGAVLSAVALIVSGLAAVYSSKSATSARLALEHSRTISRKETFLQTFNMLLDQHNKLMAGVTNYLDSRKGDQLKLNVSGTYELRSAQMITAGHPVLSPYMRVLYHLLRFISRDIYQDDTPTRKKYSSVVRSLIRNDLLTLVAINSAYIWDPEKGSFNQYEPYQLYLHEFNFFEHADFFSLQPSENHVSLSLTDFGMRARNYFLNYMMYGANASEEEKPTFLPMMPVQIQIACLYANPRQQTCLDLCWLMRHLFEKELQSFTEKHASKNSVIECFGELCGFTTHILVNGTPALAPVVVDEAYLTALVRVFDQYGVEETAPDYPEWLRNLSFADEKRRKPGFGLFHIRDFSALKGYYLRYAENRRILKHIENDTLKDFVDSAHADVEAHYRRIQEQVHTRYRTKEDVSTGRSGWRLQ